jgi:hypothetical protein
VNGRTSGGALGLLPPRPIAALFLLEIGEHLDFEFPEMRLEDFHDDALLAAIQMARQAAQTADDRFREPDLLGWLVFRFCHAA